MDKKAVFLIVSTLIILTASGCTKPCAENDYESFALFLDSPPDGSTVTYGEPVTFDWHHEESCEPYRYVFHLYDPIEDRTVQVPTMDNTSELTDYLQALLAIDKMSAVAGREYHWYVVPAGENWGQLQGEETLILAFTYGEMCTPGELDPPELVKPEDGSWAELNQAKTAIYIEWSHLGNCYPEEYHYQIATDPDFNHIVMTGKHEGTWVFDYIDVPNCTHLYWRVRSAVGNSTSAWSAPYSFYYASDNTCWLVQSPGDAALIKGYVFDDKCTGSLPYESDSNTPPQGCVSSQYGIHADGVFDAATNSEPGIGDVIVRLGSGPCPSTGLDEFSTMANGMYYFTPQAPGDYCVSVSKSDNPELEDGIWTRPLTDQIITEQTVTFSPNDMEYNQNFGWDKNEFKKLNFNVQKLSTCRQTDNKNSPAVMYLEEGSVIPVVATNEEKSWYLTLFNCFVSIATGEAEEGDLPLYPEQPIPVIDDQAGPAQANPAGAKPCSSYTSGPRDCPSPRCIWVYPIAGPGYCTEND